MYAVWNMCTVCGICVLCGIWVVCLFCCGLCVLYKAMMAFLQPLYQEFYMLVKLQRPVSCINLEWPASLIAECRRVSAADLL